MTETKKNRVHKMHWQYALLIVRQAVMVTGKQRKIATAIILAGPDCLDEQGYAHVQD